MTRLYRIKHDMPPRGFRSVGFEKELWYDVKPSNLNFCPIVKCVSDKNIKSNLDIHSRITLLVKKWYLPLIFQNKIRGEIFIDVSDPFFKKSTALTYNGLLLSHPISRLLFRVLLWVLDPHLLDFGQEVLFSVSQGE